MSLSATGFESKEARRPYCDHAVSDRDHLGWPLSLMAAIGKAAIEPVA